MKPRVVRAMEEGLSRRRRLMAEERGDFLDHNPVAEGLPSETDDALAVCECRGRKSYCSCASGNVSRAGRLVEATAIPKLLRVL